MNPDETYSLAQVAAGIAAGILGLVFLLQKFWVGFKTENTSGSLISIMHTEIERMSEQNAKLSIELGKLQEEVIQLHKELRTLNTENQRLKAEVDQLTAEVEKFKDLAIARHKETTWHDQD